MGEPDGRGASPRRSAGSALGLLAALALLLAVAGALAWIASCEVRANPDPSPTLAADDKAQGAEGAGEWPEVDWAHWLGINPDVIGWVSVPGTNVSQPIVQASADDPDYYLDHDVYRRYNPMGCPYLDAGCASGLDSPNAVVCGHNWAGGSVFADIARMSDAAYASSHSTVLLQTPTERRRLSVQAVEVASGDSPTKATSFATVAEFQAWYRERWQASCVRLSSDPSQRSAGSEGEGSDAMDATSAATDTTAAAAMPSSILTLVTCSYAHANDRTLVYGA